MGQGKSRRAQVVANLNAKYNLDKPAWQQYLIYMSGAVHGDLGPSYTYQDRSVTQIILGGLADHGLARLLRRDGRADGRRAARHLRRDAPEHRARLLALGFGTVFASVPSFVLGFVLIIVFALTFHLVPTSGWGKPNQLCAAGADARPEPGRAAHAHHPRQRARRQSPGLHAHRARQGPAASSC